MFGKEKTPSHIDIAQHEMFEYAQKRIKQKKRLFLHFIVYVLGCIFMVIINKLLNYGYQYDWFIWGIMLWTFFFMIHFINVFITDRFMGQAWQRKEREKLVAMQEKKLAKMQAQVEKEFEKQKKLAAENPDTTLPPADTDTI
ncbi:MAG: 2TM domain-containing protein [Capnocytophaga sp.]|nr:2TM domain-containing protein [Capnocytophaga sp.]